ncbi:hypothetical protein CBS147317_1275 [Penicillium roqueforti]|nr:hypothetical protein CBS147317_1275 [Penicillium roqueforti]
MPPRIDLEPFKSEILDLLSQNTTYKAILAILKQKYHISTGLSTFKSRLHDWQWESPRTRRSQLQDRIEELLPRHTTSDILTILNKDGTPSSERSVRRVRADLGIQLRLSREEREQQLCDIEAVLITESIIGEIEDFGRRTLHRHLRAMGLFYTEYRPYISLPLRLFTNLLLFSIPRAQISTVYRILRPDVVQGRLPGLRRERVNYISPGPNDVWHIDGHMKLEPFGIEIYAAIDGYSRYIIWAYVGVSARTAVSVMRQCFDVFAYRGFQPKKFRSDRGTETTLLADTQYELRKLGDPSVKPSDCYLYGRSVDNQRIEGWWGLLSRASTGLFHEYFHCLQRDNLFTKDCIPEQVSLLAIYMPVIRSRIQSYRTDWNHHPIQSQPNRPHVICGRPKMNYKYPNVHDLRCTINTDPDSEQGQLFQRLRQDVQGWNPEEYLPPATLTWCQQQLAEIGVQKVGMPFDPEDPNPNLVGDPRAPYRAVYEALRVRAFAHWEAGQNPILDVCTKPSGAASWRPDVSEEI